MLPILRHEIIRCLKLKLTDFRVLEKVSEQKFHKPLTGKNFRLMPIRFSQTKSNNEGKNESFKYKPGMSPGDFKKAGSGPYKPLYARMAGDRGKMVSGMLISVVATGVYIFKVGPHTRLKEYTQSFYQATLENGFTMKVNRKLQELIYEVIEDDLQLSGEDQINTKFFMMPVGETYCWGGYSSGIEPKGVLLGLPSYLAYESTKEIDLTKYIFGKNTEATERRKDLFLSPIKLQSEEAQLYKECLVLSDDAKRFIMARELHRGQTMQYLTNGLMMPTFIAIGYLVSRYINRKFNLFKAPPLYRIIMYGIMSTASIFTSIMLEDVSKYYTEIELDRKTCKLGLKYATGAIEYYDKVLKSNIALRSLISGNYGKNQYNLQGDYWPPFFRPYKHTPFTLRKKTCEDIYNTMELKS